MISTTPRYSSAQLPGPVDQAGWGTTAWNAGATVVRGGLWATHGVFAGLASASGTVYSWAGGRSVKQMAGPEEQAQRTEPLDADAILEDISAKVVELTGKTLPRYKDPLKEAQLLKKEIEELLDKSIADLPKPK